MNGYYIFAPLEEGCLGPFSGVEKKIRSQCKALEKHLNISLSILPIKEQSGLWFKIKTRLPFCPVSSRIWKYKGEYDGADFLYLRQVRHDYPFVRYLKAIKKKNPNIKIIYEIPTFPYDKEGSVNLKNCHVTIKDRINRKKLKKYVDRIVTFYDQGEIFGIPTIKLQNGFDFSAMTINHSEPSKDTLHLLEVSTTAFWHGYDRVIAGLQQYYQNGGNVNVVFHMVGQPLENLLEMTEQYGLSEHVIFHGSQSGEALDAIYETCLVGIDVLGGHRKNYPVSSSLKSREYSAKGLPVVTSSPIDFMEEDYPHQLLVPYDDSPLDIQSVIDFAENIFSKSSVQDVRAKIRAYAAAKCDMSHTMMPIVDYLQN